MSASPRLSGHDDVPEQDKPAGGATVDERRRRSPGRDGAVDRLLDRLPDVLTGGLEGLVPEADNLDDDDDEDRAPRRRWRRRWGKPKRSRERVEPPVVQVIGPRQSAGLERLREAFAARRLILFFGLIALRKLYQQTVLGWWWIPLRPLVEVGSRVFIFGSLLGSPSGAIPYLLFFFFGFSAWQFFQLTVVWSGRTAQVSRRIVSRIYVPRITALVGVSTVPALVNLLLYLAMAGVAALIYVIVGTPTSIEVGVGVLYLLAGLTLLLALGLSVGFWLSVLAADARDPRYLASYALRFLFFVSPVLYPLARVPEGLRTLATFNPVSAPLELVRLGVFGSGQVPTAALVSTFLAIIVIGVPGLRFFNRSEARALDAA